MRIPIKALRARVARLIPPDDGKPVSMFDVIAGAVPMPSIERLDPRHREMVPTIEKVCQGDTDDRYEAKLQGFIAEMDAPPPTA
jgi:hypothetical protein